jgi:hypothetical protein
MAQRENKDRTKQNELQKPVSEQEREQNRSAFEEAMHDIDEDPDLSEPSPNDDLDEGESARLGEEKTDLV